MNGKPGKVSEDAGTTGQRDFKISRTAHPEDPPPNTCPGCKLSFLSSSSSGGEVMFWEVCRLP